MQLLGINGKMELREANRRCIRRNATTVLCELLERRHNFPIFAVTMKMRCDRGSQAANTVSCVDVKLLSREKAVNSNLQNAEIGCLRVAPSVHDYSSNRSIEPSLIRFFV
jgi:hypothetical protein